MVTSIIYFLTGFIFSVGLALGGMLDPENIKKFLWVAYPQDWSPLLLIVLCSAVAVYAFFYWWQVRCGRCQKGVFKKAPAGKIDFKVILGSILFGIGWGLSGLCPAPAVGRLGLEPSQAATWIFVVLMFVGFKLNSWLSSNPD